jgi:hypothetical protein
LLSQGEGQQKAKGKGKGVKAVFGFVLSALAFCLGCLCEGQQRSRAEGLKLLFGS